MSQTVPTGETPPQDKHTPLYDLHVAHGGKMVPFAGYAMPVQYPAGIITEHNHTRTKAGLFDVSHMGQAWLRSSANLYEQIERLVPGEVAGLKPGRMRYTQLLNPHGGILDDLMLTKFDTDDGSALLFAVVNAGRKDADFAHIAAELGGAIDLELLPDRALIAVQGPTAAACVAQLVPGVDDMLFMSSRRLEWNGVALIVSRCGYTGEDGYEISVPSDRAVELAEALLALDDVEPIGLGARDSLRLEAGLCLYGHDITEDTTPIEAGLEWSISKRRREEGGFPGADKVQAQLKDGAPRRRVGLRPEGRAPAREGVVIQSLDGAEIGQVTSGQFAPTLGAPIAMGYVSADQAADGTRVNLVVRGKELPAEIVPMPFVPQRYYRPAK
jgi:aminomethyltransferase